MKYANWNVPERGAEIPRALLAAGCTPLLAAILHLRGLSDPAAARSFLRGGAETLTNPLELTGMVDAVQRLTRAVATGEHVAVYGDYDVDGITAACLLTDYLRERGLTCELYIPDRIRDGYGLNTAAIDALAEEGVTLIVTVDCGVTNLEETAYAAQRGVDMIVTDHHECREALPEAEAVVDPKQPDSSGVGTALAGVGVAFKLVCAMDGDADKMLARYGDLVAVGTVADVMPLLGENRFITRCGLQKIAAGNCRPGFLALAEEAGVRDKPFTASTVGFSLAPRINAAGRLAEPRGASAGRDRSAPRACAGRGAVRQKPRAAGARNGDLARGRRAAARRAAGRAHRPCLGRLASRRDRHRRLAPDGRLQRPRGDDLPGR